MSERKKLRTAVLGLDAVGQSFFDAVAKNPCFELIAAADRDNVRLNAATSQHHCKSYDDYRQLVIQNQLDCLIIAEPFHIAKDYLKTAIKKNFNILKIPPLARDCEQASELVNLAEKQGVKFAVANCSRFRKSIIELEKLIHQKTINQISLICAKCSSAFDPEENWKKDKKLAGGGTMLYDAYETLDIIIKNFGLPLQVYAWTSNYAADKKQRSYVTEDIAAATIKFSQTMAANLISLKDCYKKNSLMEIHSKDNFISITDEGLFLNDKKGQIIEKILDDNKSVPINSLLDNFAAGITDPDNNPLQSSARENLNIMATIEAVYLSAKTEMPEEPLRLLQSIQFESSGNQPY